MYRFVLRPKWLLSHLLVVALVAAMIWAGLWQLSRLGERQDQNDRIAARSLLVDVDIAEVVPSDAGYQLGDSMEFLRVTATGTFDRSEEVLVRNRPLDGSPGRWILTPLVLEDGRAVVVNRGWIPNAFEPDDPRPEADPPTGSVVISGFVRPTETATGLQIDDPDTGVLLSVARPNLERLAQQSSYPLLPVFIQMEEINGPEGLQSAPIGPLPVPLKLPPLDDGPHLGYAVQWFIFTTVAFVGYPLILRRVARGKGASLEEVLAPHNDSGDGPTRDRAVVHA